jgi:ParB family chromosome partitioning protein
MRLENKGHLNHCGRVISAEELADNHYHVGTCTLYPLPTFTGAFGLTPHILCIADANYAEVALMENLLRQDLTAVEEAEALQRLMTEQSYTQEQVGVIVGKARTTVGDILTLNKLPQEIRDECRGDRQISRSTLIDIARKKQVRGMTTAYNSYKAKQQKVKGTRQKKDVNDPAALIDVINKIMDKLKSVDKTAWSVDDASLFEVALLNLKSEIENSIPPTPTP